MTAPSRPGAPRAAAPGQARGARPSQGVRANRPAQPGRASAARTAPPARPGESTASGAVRRPREAVAPGGRSGSLAAMLSWRTLVLAGVLGVAFTLVWPSVRVYLDQQQQLAALDAERDAAQQEVDDLTAEVARWEDPAFVVGQARERLTYVFPGETPYRVVDPETAAVTADGSLDAERAAQDAGLVGTWNERLWASMQQAGAAAPAAPAAGDGDRP